MTTPPQFEGNVLFFEPFAMDARTLANDTRPILTRFRGCVVDDGLIKEVKNKYSWKKTCFLDEYYDDENNILSSNNMWLRRRDIFEWCLEVVVIKEQGIYIEEITAEDEIIEKLKRIDKIKFDVNRLSKHDRTFGTQKILGYAPKQIACIPISTWHTNDIEGFEIHMSSCCIGNEEFCNVVTCTTRNAETNISDNIKLFKEIMKHLGESNVIRYICKNDSLFYNDLKKKAIVPKIGQPKNVLTSCLFPSDYIPSGKMKTYADFAIEERVCLLSASSIINYPAYPLTDDEYYFESPHPSQGEWDFENE